MSTVRSRTPSARAASTYAVSRITSTEPRTTRATRGEYTMPMRDDHVDDARPERGHERDREDDGGKRHQPVHDPHEHVVEPAVVPAQRARTRTPTTNENSDDRDADDQRQPRAVDDAAPHVAPDVVGAEPVRRARRAPAAPARPCRRGSPADERREDRRRAAFSTTRIAPTSGDLAPEQQPQPRPARGGRRAIGDDGLAHRLERRAHDGPSRRLAVRRAHWYRTRGSMRR